MPKKETRHKLLERQIYRLQRRLTDLARQSDRYSYLRLLTFIGGFIINAITFITAGPAWLWLTFLLSAVIFLTTVYIHNRVEEVRMTAHISQSRSRCGVSQVDRIIQAEAPVMGPYISRAIGTIQAHPSPMATMIPLATPRRDSRSIGESPRARSRVNMAAVGAG
jgi:hypothetical protein